VRLVTFEIAGQPRPGVLAGDGIIDLQPLGADLRAILQGGSLERIRSMLKSAPTPIPAKSARLLAPIQNPGMVLSCGMNYYEHLKEMKTPVPQKPAAFTKSVADLFLDRGDGSDPRVGAQSPGQDVPDVLPDGPGAGDAR